MAGSKKLKDLSPKKNPAGGMKGKERVTVGQDNITLVRAASLETRRARR